MMAETEAESFVKRYEDRGFHMAECTLCDAVVPFSDEAERNVWAEIHGGVDHQMAKRLTADAGEVPEGGD